MIEDIFKKSTFDEEKLKKYGFIHKDGIYTYEKILLDDLKAIITIKDGKLSGKVIDTTFGDEYISFRYSNAEGYSLKVCDEYEKLLEDIKSKCTDTDEFLYPQTKRIAKLIKDKFGETGDKPWNSKKDKDNIVFRNHLDNKWYALIMPITQDKLGLDGTDVIEVINLKVHPWKIDELVEKKGIYNAYHMNKKNWITITLDDSLTDEEVFKYVKESRSFTKKDTPFIVPISPRYFDLVKYFHEYKSFEYLKPRINYGDTVYYYVTSPVKALKLKCKVEDLGEMNRYTLVEEYPDDLYTFKKLKTYGITMLRGPIHMPEKLLDELGE